MGGDHLPEPVDDRAGLLVGEVPGEVPLDAGQIDGGGAAQRVATGGREHSEAGAPVGGVGLARNQPGVGEPVDQAADPGHAEVAFIGRHFVLTKVRGRFTGVQGQITVAQDPDRSTVEVTIDMASVSSGDQARDEHLRSADFFDVDQYPAATYRSTQVSWAGRHGSVRGELTIRGVTRSR